ncbi:uncharacterized protein LOC128883950 isoform X2 [Hylaeus volcanicus]|uniref:uncharacterized protein LOC128883950 isoform X2 n=1 Tax=Hylaeus volcanicus TaxID=313075 RepID=UPI0023B880EA|nr:uncharacterized protein LOC128883950 isoform X2 [Hylaeus volcanicus]
MMSHKRQSDSFIHQVKAKRNELPKQTMEESEKDTKIYHLLVYSNFDILMFFLLCTNLSNFFISRALSFDICAILYLASIIIIFFVDRVSLRCGCACFCICFGAFITNALMMETHFSIPDLLDIPFFFILTGFPLPILVLMASQNFFCCVILKFVVRRSVSNEITFLTLQIIIVCFLFCVKLIIGLLLYFQFFIISKLATNIKNHPSQSMKFIPEFHAMEEKAITTLPIAFSLSQKEILSAKEHAFILLRLYQYSKFRNVILSMLREDSMNPLLKMRNWRVLCRKRQGSFFFLKHQTKCFSFTQFQKQEELQQPMKKQSDTQANHETYADNLILKYFLGNSLIHFFYEMYPNQMIQSKLREGNSYVVKKKYLEAALKAHYGQYQKQWHKRVVSLSDDCTTCQNYINLPTELSEKPHLPYNASEIEVLQSHSVLSLSKPFKQNYDKQIPQERFMILKSSNGDVLFPLDLVDQLNQHVMDSTRQHSLLSLLKNYQRKQKSKVFATFPKFLRNKVTLLTNFLRKSICLRHETIGKTNTSFSLNKTHEKEEWSHKNSLLSRPTYQGIKRPMSFDPYKKRCLESFKWFSLYFLNNFLLRKSFSALPSIKTNKFISFNSRLFRLDNSVQHQTCLLEQCCISKDAPGFHYSRKFSASISSRWPSGNNRNSRYRKTCSLHDFKKREPKLYFLYHKTRQIWFLIQQKIWYFMSLLWSIRCIVEYPHSEYIPAQISIGSFLDTRVERWYLIWSNNVFGLLLCKLRWIHLALCLLQVLLLMFSFCISSIALQPSISTLKTKFQISLKMILFSVQISFAIYVALRNSISKNCLHIVSHEFKIRTISLAIFNLLLVQAQVFLDSSSLPPSHISLTTKQSTLLYMSAVLKESSLFVCLLSFGLQCFASEKITNYSIGFICITTLFLGPLFGYIIQTWPENMRTTIYREYTLVPCLGEKYNITVIIDKTVVYPLVRLLYLYGSLFLLYYFIKLYKKHFDVYFLKQLCGTLFILMP